MSTDNRSLTISAPAAADLTGKKYYAVKLNAQGEVALASAITDIVIGILQNEPSAQGLEASVCVSGVSKVVLGATVATGALVGVSAAGKAVADASTNFTLGPLMSGGVSGDVASVLLNRMTVK